MKAFRRTIDETETAEASSPRAAHNRSNRAGAPQDRAFSRQAWDEAARCGNPPELALLQAPSESPGTGANLAEGLLEQWRAYRKQLSKSRKDFTMRNIHRLRVQTRRLMSRLALIDEILPRRRGPKAACRTLKQRLAVLGEIRDTHVQSQFVESKRQRFPGSEPLGRYLRERERELTKSTFKRVKRFGTSKLGRRLDDLRRELGGKNKPRQRPAALASAVWQATERSFEEVLRRRAAIDISDSKTIHRTRIAFKRFRYMLECSPVETLRPNRGQLARMAAYQRKMGNIQDTEVLLGVVHEFEGEHKGARRDLAAFTEYLERRRARLLHVYLNSVDDLLDFWPPPAKARAR
jgi:CHAD domain-containing protein